jgi:hypothetical protein
MEFIMNHHLVSLFEMSVTDIRANRNRFKSQKDKGLAVLIISSIALLMLLFPDVRDRISSFSRTGEASSTVLYVYSIANVCFFLFSYLVFRMSKRYYDFLTELDYSRQDVMKLKGTMSDSAFKLVREYYETHHLICRGHLIVAQSVSDKQEDDAVVA